MNIIQKIHPDIPVIEQTAYGLSEDKYKAANAGFKNYISKPISKDLLHDILNKHIDIKVE